MNSVTLPWSVIERVLSNMANEWCAVAGGASAAPASSAAQARALAIVIGILSPAVVWCPALGRETSGSATAFKRFAVKRGRKRRKS